MTIHLHQLSALPPSSLSSRTPTPIPSFSSPSLLISSKKTKRNKKQQRPYQRTKEKKKSSPSPYPKSTPTPLFLAPPAPPPTQSDALDRLLLDLDLSISRGVPIRDPSLFSSLLESCFRLRSPHHAPLLHRLIPPSLLRSAPSLPSKLLRLYSSSGRLDLAHHLFDEMPPRARTAAAFPWNSLISGYADAGRYDDAMALYFQMDEDGVEPDRFTFPRALKACAGLRSARLGEAVHRHAVRSGFGDDPFVLNALVDMYAKCGDIVKARRAFERIADRGDPVSWNSMLVGYIRHGLPLEAVDICRGILQAGLEPDSVAVSAMLAGFPTDNGKLGLEIHGWVLRRGLEGNLSVANSLIGMYSESGQLGRARMIFESIPDKDVVSWNAVINAHRKDRRVLDMFRRMEDSGTPPDRVTFVSLLSACANLGMVEDGRRFFSEMEERYGITPEMEHYGCMVNMLGRAGFVGEAYELASKSAATDSGPTVWGALLFACSVHGNVAIGEAAAERLFEVEPDNEHNFDLLMKIYRNAGRLEEVEKVRKLMRDRGLESSVQC